MERELLPSERLAARIEAQRARSDVTVQAYIETAEEQFRDPLSIIKAEWIIDGGIFIFSRPVHQFSDYEAFIFKFALVLGCMGDIDRSGAMAMMTSVTYAEGRSTMEGHASPGNGDYVVAHQMVSKGNSNFVPRKTSEYANLITSKVQQYQRGDGPLVLKNWLDRHVTPSNQDTARSVLFSETPGPYAIPLGKNLRTGRTVHYIGEASLLTVAPPGKGKTQCHILPTLASYRGPVIALDIKGECYAQTAAWREREVGPVIRFNPVDPEQSASYNPLAFLDTSPDELWESARFLADLLVLKSQRGDPTWENQGRDLLTLIIAFTGIIEREDRTMAKVLDLVATVGLAEMMEGVARNSTLFPGAMRRAAARFHQMSSNAPKQFEGVLGAAAEHLQVWEGPKVERVTGRTDWSPEDFKRGPFPSLYLCIPPEALDTYAPILRVIIGQHVRRLMRGNVKPEAPILFLLDELPRLGHMQPIREALEVGRSYGIKLWMIAQYPEQIVHAYPGVGDGMMDSCDVRMYMNPSSGTADRLAKAFGKGQNVLGQGKTHALEASEITGPLHRDSIFALAANETPMILAKSYFHQAGKG